MPDTTLVPAQTPSGETLVVPVVDLDGTASVDHPTLPSLTPALKTISDFSAKLQQALHTTTSKKTTFEFSIGFAMRAGTITPVLLNSKTDAAIVVTTE